MWYKRMVDERQWYVGTPLEEAPPVVAQADPLPSASTVATAPPGEVSPAVLRACKEPREAE